MNRNPIADIINSQWNHILNEYNSHKIRTLAAVKNCRTPAMGGSLYVCTSCKKYHKRYHSCRNRHCPQCQNTQKMQWAEKRQEQLIDTQYFHVVFTIPEQFNGLFLGYSRQLYKLLFDSTWEVLNQFGWTHKYLGAQIGATMVLHTWGSNMSFHPHIHCIVPGGGVSFQNKWKEVKTGNKFLFPVKAMSLVFRAVFMKRFYTFCRNNGLDDIDDLVKSVYRKSWVVYAKPPFGGSKGVIDYLARYTHKIAMTNQRIISYDQETVTFSYTDYKHKNQKKVMPLSTKEFIRRFAQHILPKRFVRIRHYGMLSSSYRKILFPKKKKSPKVDWMEFWKKKGLDVLQCPACEKGRLRHLSDFRPKRGPPKKITSRQITKAT